MKVKEKVWVCWQQEIIDPKPWSRCFRQGIKKATHHECGFYLIGKPSPPIPLEPTLIESEPVDDPLSSKGLEEAFVAFINEASEKFQETCDGCGQDLYGNSPSSLYQWGFDKFHQHCLIIALVEEKYSYSTIADALSYTRANIHRIFRAHCPDYTMPPRTKFKTTKISPPVKEI